jgi:Na+/H+ antiporter NhaD/arsenite permease-like protein
MSERGERENQKVNRTIDRGVESLEFTITTDGIIKAAAVLAALGGIGAVVMWCIRFVQRQKHQAKELTAIREEQSMICYGVLACLKGLKEQGCDGPVSAALEKLETHLNQAAHKGEDDG